MDVVRWCIICCVTRTPCCLCIHLFFWLRLRLLRVCKVLVRLMLLPMVHHLQLQML